MVTEEGDGGGGEWLLTQPCAPKHGHCKLPLSSSPKVSVFSGPENTVEMFWRCLWPTQSLSDHDRTVICTPNESKLSEIKQEKFTNAGKKTGQMNNSPKRQ